MRPEQRPIGDRAWRSGLPRRPSLLGLAIALTLPGLAAASAVDVYFANLSRYYQQYEAKVTLASRVDPQSQAEVQRIASDLMGADTRRLAQGYLAKLGQVAATDRALKEGVASWLNENSSAQLLERMRTDRRYASSLPGAGSAWREVDAAANKTAKLFGDASRHLSEASTVATSVAQGAVDRFVAFILGVLILVDDWHEANVESANDTVSEAQEAVQEAASPLIACLDRAKSRGQACMAKANNASATAGCTSAFLTESAQCFALYD